MTLFFDFDGTLVHSKKIWLFTFKKALRKHGFKFKYQEIEPYLGPTVKGVLERLIDKKDKKLTEKITKEVYDLRNKIGIELKLRSQPSLLKRLASLYTLILRTNSDYASTSKFLKRHKIFNLWKMIITPEKKIGRSKIKALKFIKNRFKPPFIYLADMRDDIRAAKTVRIETIALSGGWEKEKDLKKENPNFLIKRLNSLPKILEKINL